MTTPALTRFYSRRVSRVFFTSSFTVNAVKNDVKYIVKNDVKNDVKNNASSSKKMDAHKSTYIFSVVTPRRTLRAVWLSRHDQQVDSLIGFDQRLDHAHGR